MIEVSAPASSPLTKCTEQGYEPCFSEAVDKGMIEVTGVRKATSHTKVTVANEKLSTRISIAISTGKFACRGDIDLPSPRQTHIHRIRRGHSQVLAKIVSLD
jgi:hypothetical protein